jgi:hypothetical protein
VGSEQARLTRLGQRSRPLIFAGTLRPGISYLRRWGHRGGKCPARPKAFAFFLSAIETAGQQLAGSRWAEEVKRRRLVRGLPRLQPRPRRGPRSGRPDGCAQSRLATLELAPPRGAAARWASQLTRSSEQHTQWVNPWEIAVVLLMRPVSVRDAGTYAGFDGLLIWLDAPLCLDWTAVWSRRSSWNHSCEL